jgi:two-component system OmpR family response regulator
MSRILVVDDDPAIREVLGIALKQAGHSVLEAGDGVAALARLAEGPDLVVLDIGMPEMDGLEVCREIRRDNAVPVLFLTARADEVDRIVGLEMGADDYVAKPFSPREVMARIKAILKRSAPVAQSDVLRRGVVEVDASRHLCRILGATVPLTGREMDLLARLMGRPDHVLSRVQLVDAMYGTNIHVSDRTVDSHLRNLRAKLRDAGVDDAIETVHGVGVRMGACVGV